MELMKAMQVRKAGEPMRIVDIPIPKPNENQVLIEVETCGVCNGDSTAIEGRAKNYPLTPGHEVVGIIKELGKQVKQWEVGQRVGTGYHAADGNVNGRTIDGGFAEFMLAHQDFIVAIPEDMPSAQASPLMCAGEAVFSALLHCQAKAGDIVAIQGLGGLGHLAIQFAKKMGFETVAISRSNSKQDIIELLGANHYINSTNEDIGEALTNLGGAKVVLTTVPSAKAISPLLAGLKAHGQIVIVSGTNEQFDISPSQLLTNYTSLTGSFTAGKEEILQTLRFSELNHVQPYIELFNLEEANEAFNKMKEAKVKFRAVLKIKDR